MRQILKLPRYWMIATSLAAGLLALLSPTMAAQAGNADGPSPLGQHCYDVGPLPGLPPDWCGCTWGAVYVDGQPVSGANVTLTFAGQTVTAQSSSSALEPFPYYALHAYDLGARYGDIATLTASYAGQVITRTVRLVPDSVLKEQQLNFAFVERSHWEPFAAVSAVRALATSGPDLWVGTTTRLVQWDLSTGISSTHSTGLGATAIQDIAVAANGDVWVGTPAGVSRYTGQSWAIQNTGLPSSNVRALATAANGDVFAGTYHARDGGVSRFDGSAWQSLPDLNGARPNLVTALAVDDAGNLWAGSDGYGVARWNGATWQGFTTADGLSSDVIYDIASAPGAAWFGAGAYLAGATSYGGASRYSLAGGTWTRYRQADGLAGDDVVEVALGDDGFAWFSAWNHGISRFDGRNWRTYTVGGGLRSNDVRALAVGADGVVWAGFDQGLDRFVPGPSGHAPMISQMSVAPTSGAVGAPLRFSVIAEDGDEGGSAIVGYEWASDRDGPLGSEATFVMPISLLTPGLHTFSVRVLDDEGQWSASQFVQFMVVQPRVTFLPLIAR